MKSVVATSSFIIVIFLCIQCNPTSSDKIAIVPFDLLNNRDTFTYRGEILFNKSEYFLIKNYSKGKSTEDYIDSFVNANKDSNLDKYSNYGITFYKESAKTNIQNITKNPRDLDRYSQKHDLVYKYKWINGKFIYRFKFKNGELVPKSDIIVKDIPDSMK